MNDFKKLCESTQFYGEKNDCTVKCLAIICDLTYGTAWTILKNMGRKKGRGFSAFHTLNAIEQNGKKVKEVTDLIGERTIQALEKRGLTQDYVVTTRSHILAIRGGKVIDWTSGRHHRIERVWRIS